MPKKSNLRLLVIVGSIVLLVAGFVMSAYNALVGFEENTENAFAKIETQLERRFDLIPNVIATVKGSASFEQQTLQGIVNARSAWTQAATVGEKIDATNSFDSALSRLLVTVEAYPDLKSTQAFRDLLVELEGTENRIGFARNEYNDAATAYNKATRRFPKNLVAQLFAFDSEKELFAAVDGAAAVPVVDFGENQ